MPYGMAFPPVVAVAGITKSWTCTRCGVFAGRQVRPAFLNAPTSLYVAVSPEQPATVAEVAAAYRLSHHHLAKVAQSLTRQGYLRTVRGRHGGLKLAVPPEEINVGDLVRSVEPDWNVVECFTDIDRCAITPACRLKGILKDATDAFLRVLDGHTVADLLANRQRLQTLLGVRVIPLVEALPDAATRSVD